IKKLIDDNRKDLRRIFTWYYYQWVEYEKNGTLKLDRIARDFFFLHCPFTKAIRDQIVKIPAYSDLNRKYTIITERNLTRLENKFKKLRDENGILPPELQEHLDYYCK
ncbi:MAG TPA: hypothetical protein DC049_15425, partial [Spirochaetia bacterium]|nr:hypothetical protein [Spirochaetia bacterium]